MSLLVGDMNKNLQKINSSSIIQTNSNEAIEKIPPAIEIELIKENN